MEPAKVISIHDARKRVAKIRQSKGRQVVRRDGALDRWLRSSTTKGHALIVGLLACVMVAAVVAGVMNAAHYDASTETVAVTK
jgi:hypothetical protein